MNNNVSLFLIIFSSVYMKSVKLSNSEIKSFMEKTSTFHHLNPKQYESIRIKDGDVFFVLYNSGKLVYNDTRRCLSILDDILEKRDYFKENSFGKNENSIYNNTISMKKYQYIIGSDETGKGEWYGPLVVCAVCTSNDDILKLKSIGVKDSKKLSTKEIFSLYEKIEKLNITYEVIVLKPFSYNKLYTKFTNENKNLNHLLAHLHYKVINQLLTKINTTDVLVIIDKFDYKKMNQYLDINPKIDVIQETNGEKYIPVATSSIIAKYYYEKTLKEIEERYNINRKIKPKNIEKDIIDKVAKTHFKNIKPYT